REEGMMNGLGCQGDGNEGLSMDGLRITDIDAMKGRVLKMLKLIRMLYPALRKRRISTFPPFNRTSSLEALPSEEHLTLFGKIIDLCKELSTATDDLAGALYDRDVDSVQGQMESMVTIAKTCLGGVQKGWNGEADEFTEWSGNWISRVTGIIQQDGKKDT
ncbi:MAG: hypothetical protein Q9200_006864, partial [Gallowayella weberi]